MSSTVTLRSIYISFAAVLTMYICGAAVAQSNLHPSIQEMHQVLENAVSTGNRQLANKRIDDFTVLKMMTYDRGVPVFTYHYSTNILRVTGQISLNAASIKAMNDYHRTKTCSTPFAIFMRVFGLKVSHRFEDIDTGIQILRITIQGSDC